MNLKYLPLLSLLIFLSCSLKERAYENEYLKVVLPDGWTITEKNNTEDSRWLVSTLIPIDEKFFKDSTTEAPIQNFIIVAVNSNQMAAKYGPMDFSPYCKELYERQKARGISVSKFDIVDLKGKQAYHWESTISREGKGPLIQEQYMFQLPPFYASFQLTHSVKGKTTDSQKILNSVVFKK
ncbi:hypothetical protein [Spirosoma linguale]|uniref:Lipoprotein n=1 Tax=Spirosoma linguale (strain ATCC 33905 / DSM 74 / LMG 10896 / Claus 1) TaxID=504472 RepID=D2QRX1_SPILD|nr:hypothetical protein Slin_5588 [Spirosoma linguale DSM 74]